MNEPDMQNALIELLDDVINGFNTPDEVYPPEGMQDIDSVLSFEEAGILTMNKGLVLRMKDCREFQITIVQSR